MKKLRTSPGTNTPSLRRDLQRAYLDRMITLVANAPGRTPADARSVARHQLRISKALDAGFTLRN